MKREKKKRKIEKKRQIDTIDDQMKGSKKKSRQRLDNKTMRRKYKRGNKRRKGI